MTPMAQLQRIDAAKVIRSLWAKVVTSHSLRVAGTLALLPLMMLSGGCDTEKAMPLDANHMAAYDTEFQFAMTKSIGNSISPAPSQSADSRQRENFVTVHVQPLTEMGYSYEKTVLAALDVAERGAGGASSQEGTRDPVRVFVERPAEQAQNLVTWEILSQKTADRLAGYRAAHPNGTGQPSDSGQPTPAAQSPESGHIPIILVPGKWYMTAKFTPVYDFNSNFGAVNVIATLTLPPKAKFQYMGTEVLPRGVGGETLEFADIDIPHFQGEPTPGYVDRRDLANVTEVTGN